MDYGHNDGMGQPKPGIIYHQIKQFNRPHAQSQLEENICAVSITSLYCPIELRQLITELQIDTAGAGAGEKTPARAKAKMLSQDKLVQTNRG